MASGQSKGGGGRSSKSTNAKKRRQKAKGLSSRTYRVNSKSLAEGVPF